MKYKGKNSLLFMLYAICIGAITGLIVWCFLKIMNISIEFIWKTLPNRISIPFYTIIVCTLGGLIIGIWKKKTGDYPEELETVMGKVKKEGRYSYHNIGAISVSAMLPLVFGGSIGPEAGLTGVIAGLCTWVGDKFKHLFKEMKVLTQIGISATLGTIFNSPMFGFIEPIESEKEGTALPKTPKMILYFLAIFGAFGMFVLLNHFFQGSSEMATFEGLEIGIREWIWLLPLSLMGMVAGYFYYFSRKVVIKLSSPIQNNTIIKGVLGGILLGIAGTLLPYTMFSGEHQMKELIINWQEIGVGILLVTAIVKLLITNICIHTGLKGGHFFPCIFSGICIGYAFSILTGVNPVFCVSVITTALMASLMKKPLATVLLLMICFPVAAIPVMLLAAVIGSMIKLPKVLEINNEKE